MSALSGRSAEGAGVSPSCASPVTTRTPPPARAISISAAVPCSGGAAREAGAARSAWTPGAGRSSSPRSSWCSQCVITGPTRGRHWTCAAARADSRRTASEAGVRRRFAPCRLRHAHASARARRRAADRHPAPIRPQQPRHHLRRPAGHRQAAFIATVHAAASGRSRLHIPTAGTPDPCELSHPTRERKRGPLRFSGSCDWGAQREHHERQQVPGGRQEDGGGHRAYAA